MQKDIKQTWFFEQPPKEVWEYLTNPELMEQWLMKTDFKPVEAHKFSFFFTPKPGSPYDALVQCEVLEVNPYSTLCYSWNGYTKDRSRNYSSKVLWTLIPKENGTELQLQHSGFNVMEDFLNTSNGWNTCIERMKEKFNLTQK